MLRELNMRPWLPLLAGMLMAITYSKGGYFALIYWGEPYAVITYGHGIIKRGLMGEIMAWLFNGVPLTQLKTAFLELHFLLSLLLGYTLFVLVRKVEKIAPTESLGFWLMMLMCGASLFWSTLASTPGYLDVYQYLLLTLFILAYFAQRYWLAACICAVAPFLHESSVFVWLPIYVLVAWDCVKQRQLLWKHIAPLIVLVLSTLAILLLHTNEAGIKEIQGVELYPGVAKGMIDAQLGQTLQSSFKTMIDKWTLYPRNGIFNLFFFGWPSAVMLGVYLAARRVSKLDGAILALAILAPLSILLFAWDISRFIVYTNFVTLLVVVWWEYYHRPQSRPLKYAPFVVALSVFILFMTPAVYTYFELFLIHNRGVFNFSETLIGRALRLFSYYYQEQRG